MFQRIFLTCRMQGTHRAPFTHLNARCESIFKLAFERRNKKQNQILPLRAVVDVTDRYRAILVRKRQ